MAYLSKSLSVGQLVVVTLESTADREEVAQRLTLDGIRLRVMSVKPDIVKVGVRGPAGLTPKRGVDVDVTGGALALARSADQEIIVTLAEGADADAALDWLASDGVCFRLAAIKGQQSVFSVRACDDLLILRDELVPQA